MGIRRADDAGAAAHSSTLGLEPPRQSDEGRNATMSHAPLASDWLKVHYLGWRKEFDDWIPRSDSRLARLYSHRVERISSGGKSSGRTDWRQTIVPGNKVEWRTAEVEDGWYPGTVRAIVRVGARNIALQVSFFI